MNSAMDVVQLSRLQFGLTAMYHFLFVPLTLGLAVLLSIMESVHVMTGREIWQQMTKFWGLLFGINFAMGVATGITMEFQFGMNWDWALFGGGLVPVLIFGVAFGNTIEGVPFRFDERAGCASADKRFKNVGRDRCMR